MDPVKLQKLRDIQKWPELTRDTGSWPEWSKQEATFEHDLQNGKIDEKAANWLRENLKTIIQNDKWAQFKRGLELLECKVIYVQGDYERALQMFQQKDIILASSPRENILYGDMLVYQASYILRNILVALPTRGTLWNFTRDIIKVNYNRGNALRSSSYHFCEFLHGEATWRTFTAEDKELAGFVHAESVPSHVSKVRIPSIEYINGLKSSDRSYRIAANNVTLKAVSTTLRSKMLCNYPLKLGMRLAGLHWRTIISNIRGVLVDGSNNSVTSLNGGLTIAEDVLCEDQLQIVLLKMMFRKESDGLILSA